MASDILIYEGCNYFRQRMVLATLCGKTVKIKKIRARDDNPGLRAWSWHAKHSVKVQPLNAEVKNCCTITDFEASFIRLLDKITNGSKIVVSETGTCVMYQPGILIGGRIEHDCNIQRAIGYYLEALLCLSPFTKEPVRAVLRGITNDQIDPSVDLIKMSVFPVLKRFLGIDEGLELKVSRRGAAPDGGGEVVFTCPSRQKLRPLQLTDPGKVKRIRGIAWAVRVSPAVANRIVDSTRSILNKCLPDIYIYTDHHKGSQSGKSPGFGLTLVAETTNGVFLCVESVSNPKGSEAGVTVPEDLGRKTAQLLLQEIYKGGCVDSTSQSMSVLLMVLGQQDVSKLQTGPLTPYTIQFLRHIQDFVRVMFKIDPVTKLEDEDNCKTGGDQLLLTCVGVGFSNISKRIT